MAKTYQLTEELKNNAKFSKQEVNEMVFYIQQTFDRYQTWVRGGYLAMEEKFIEAQGGTIVVHYDAASTEHQKYIQTSFGSDLCRILEFIQSADKDKFIEENELFFNGSFMGGLNDSLSDIIAPCLSSKFMMENGVLEIPCSFTLDRIPLLLVNFLAGLKLHYGSLEKASGCPALDYHHESLFKLEVDYKLFSFRELTLLSGYKTERAIRNLASKSTASEKRLATVKQGRQTFVEHSEVVRWLKQNNKF